MRKELYLEIKNRIKGILDAGNQPVFKHFDLWNRQVEFLEQEAKFQCPAIFVEFNPIVWDKLTEDEQTALPVVRIHIVTNWYGQTADYSPKESEMLNYLNLPDVLYQHLMLFDAGSAFLFERTQSITNHNHERLVDSVEEYSCRIIDRFQN
ncbi:MAG: hypothetical protein LBK03_04560 [Bacteroidales bacterium]|jgi:hypothetical protein|nr:hypothetical protein [Bacteroidales bacterium]